MHRRNAALIIPSAWPESIAQADVARGSMRICLNRSCAVPMGKARHNCQRMCASTQSFETHRLGLIQKLLHHIARSLRVAIHRHVRQCPLPREHTRLRRILHTQPHGLAVVHRQACRVLVLATAAEPAMTQPRVGATDEQEVCEVNVE